MKQNKGTYFVVLAVFAILLSACGGAPAAAPAEQAAVKVDASLIAYTGTVESIAGNQWVVNGQPLTVDPGVIKDGPFKVGDTIKVEGSLNTDGSFTVTRVELPSADDLVRLPTIGDEPVNDNTNDANVNDDNANTNDANSNDVNINDDNTNDDDNANSNVNNNGNSNDDDDDDDNNNNSNSNDDDDDDDDNSNGNSNDDDDDDKDDDNSNDD